ncbi:MAG: hypothetical protein ACI8UC_000201 [Psychromonas sp.]|jgi:hypothetical protein
MRVTLFQVALVLSLIILMHNNGLNDRRHDFTTLQLIVTEKAFDRLYRKGNN